MIHWRFLLQKSYIFVCGIVGAMIMIIAGWIIIRFASTLLDGLIISLAVSVFGIFMVGYCALWPFEGTTRIGRRA